MYPARPFIVMLSFWFFVFSCELISSFWFLNKNLPLCRFRLNKNYHLGIFWIALRSMLVTNTERILQAAFIQWVLCCFWLGSLLSSLQLSDINVVVAYGYSIILLPSNYVWLCSGLIVTWMLFTCSCISFNWWVYSFFYGLVVDFVFLPYKLITISHIPDVGFLKKSQGTILL